MYSDPFGNAMPSISPHSAARSPSEASEIPMSQGMAGPELDMLGMDGGTFWAPWIPNTGLDGGGIVDEPLNNNYGRPPGW